MSYKPERALTPRGNSGVILSQLCRNELQAREGIDTVIHMHRI